MANSNWYTPGDITKALRDKPGPSAEEKARRQREKHRAQKRQWYRENRDATKHYENLKRQLKRSDNEI